MALAQPLWNHTKKMALLMEPALQLWIRNNTQVKLTAGLIVTGAEGHADGSYGCGDMDIGTDVIRLCNEGKLEDALQIFHFMEQQGIGPSSSIYDSFLQACVNQKALLEGKLIHAHMIATGFDPDIFLGTKLIIMYTKCGSLVDARQVLDKMPQKNVAPWTAMISAYARYGFNEEALTLFYQMQGDGIRPDKYTLAGVLPACANLGDLIHGKEIHEGVIKGGFQSDVFLGSALVDMYSKCGSIRDARHVFDKMSERDVVLWNAVIAGYAQNGYVDDALELFQKTPMRDVVSWTAIIAGYARDGHFNEALKLFRQMQLTGVKSDSVAFSIVLSACANLAALRSGKEIHENIIRCGLRIHISVGNALIDMYAKCGVIKNACQVFEKMPKRDSVSWNSMILGYAKHGFSKEALHLFELMQHWDMKPDHVTFIGVLLACCHAGLVNDGWQYFNCMSRDYHIKPAVEHYGCMVDLLGRAGHLEEVQDFIDKMPIKPDAAVWGSLLGACKIHTNIELGERVAEHLFELEPKNAACYVLLSNIYAAAGRWDDVENMRKMIKERRLTKSPGCSWIEVNNKM